MCIVLLLSKCLCMSVLLTFFFFCQHIAVGILFVCLHVCIWVDLFQNCTSRNLSVVDGGGGPRDFGVVCGARPQTQSSCLESVVRGPLWLDQPQNRGGGLWWLTYTGPLSRGCLFMREDFFLLVALEVVANQETNPSAEPASVPKVIWGQTYMWK